MVTSDLLWDVGSWLRPVVTVPTKLGERRLGFQLRLAGEGFEVVGDVLWDVGSWLRPVVTVLVKFGEGRFRGPWLNDLVTGLVVDLIHGQILWFLDSREAGFGAGRGGVFAGRWWVEEERMTCPIMVVSRRQAARDWATR